MSIKSTIVDKKLTLEVEDGDYDWFMEVFKKWKFRDPENMLGFCISALYMNDDNSFMVNSEGRACLFAPNKELLEEKSTVH